MDEGVIDFQNIFAHDCREGGVDRVASPPYMTGLPKSCRLHLRSL